MAKLRVELVRMEAQVLHGLWKQANDKTVAADVGALSAQYNRAVCSQGGVLPYYVLSRGYDERSRSFGLFVGSTAGRDGLERLVLPAGVYARVTVRPKLGFLWGASVGEAKRYVYTQWLPQSPYEALNLEYELHTEQSVGKRPSVDLIFAVRPR